MNSRLRAYLWNAILRPPRRSRPSPFLITVLKHRKGAGAVYLAESIIKRDLDIAMF